MSKEDRRNRWSRRKQKRPKKNKFKKNKKEKEDIYNTDDEWETPMVFPSYRPDWNKK